MSLDPLELSEGVLLALPPIALAAILHWVCIPTQAARDSYISTVFQLQCMPMADPLRAGRHEPLCCHAYLINLLPQRLLSWCLGLLGLLLVAGACGEVVGGCQGSKGRRGRGAFGVLFGDDPWTGTMGFPSLHSRKLLLTGVNPWTSCLCHYQAIVHLLAVQCMLNPLPRVPTPVSMQYLPIAVMSAISQEVFFRAALQGGLAMAMFLGGTASLEGNLLYDLGAPCSIGMAAVVSGGPFMAGVCCSARGTLALGLRDPRTDSFPWLPWEAERCAANPVLQTLSAF